MIKGHTGPKYSNNNNNITQKNTMTHGLRYGTIQRFNFQHNSNVSQY